MFLAIRLYSSSYYWEQPYHTSKLSGHAWVQELIHGHPERIQNELGMRLHVFLAFVGELRACGLKDTRYIEVEEQAAIFLYMCVLQTCFDDCFGTAVLHKICLPPFANSPLHPFLASNPKFAAYFPGAVAAIDGTHIPCCPSAAEAEGAWDRKGGLTQNCLAACTWGLRFIYFISGWEGATADGTMFARARLTDLYVAPGKYYIADAGFGICDSLLTPYRRVRYHLKEWGRAAVRPVNAQELFNLCHAHARNIIERIFGIFKEQFAILSHPANFSLQIQIRIPPGLAAIHNMIIDLDPLDLQEHLEEQEARGGPPDPCQGEPPVFLGELANGPVSRAEERRASSLRDGIAQRMWVDYQHIVQERAQLQQLQ
ncbi:hypothetical protein NUW54_g7212 [Trametes sanguinea]|uniref:Uncharacterized protein n=1 Tax=Trametes sanguinea TaxID=158606 RepID=A0ACC1PPJ9_9APHY|nr:hypothetical protein NUW54_g7212 [Trametes sanguinea]